MESTTKRFECRTFQTMGEAYQYSEAAGGEAIVLEGEYVVLDEATARELQAAGVPFAWIIEHETPEPDGSRRLMTVPVND
jgi:hypothetical protein